MQNPRKDMPLENCIFLEKMYLWRLKYQAKKKKKSCMLDQQTPITVLSVPVTYPKAAICSYSTTY